MRYSVPFQKTTILSILKMAWCLFKYRKINDEFCYVVRNKEENIVVYFTEQERTRQRPCDKLIKELDKIVK